MGLKQRGNKNIYYLYMRVPKRFQSIENRKHFVKSLNTDSFRVASKKESDAEALQISIWEARLAGRDDDALKYQKTLSNICSSYGYQFLDVGAVSDLSVTSLVERINAVDQEDVITADALFGTPEAPALLMSQLFDEFMTHVAEELTQKSEKQIHKWKNDKLRCINTFIQAVGDIDVAKIQRTDVMKFRTFLGSRIASKDLKPYSANRELYTLGNMVKVVSDLVFGSRTRVFDDVLFKDKKTKKRNRQLSFSTPWIQNKIMHQNAFDEAAVDEIRAVLYGMINTGARPSELYALNSKTIMLDSNIPHLNIIADGRELKSVWAERTIPLVGVSLEVFRGYSDGFNHYQDSDSWSDLINGYLSKNNLLETDAHVAYCMRHSFSDRLKDADCDGDLRRELMGHAPVGTDYGEGASMETKLRWIQKIAL